jgi:hypothetical protein
VIKLNLIAALVLLANTSAFGLEIHSKLSQFSFWNVDKNEWNRSRFELTSKVESDLSDSISAEVSARAFFDPAVFFPERFSDSVKDQEAYEALPRSAFLEWRSLPTRARLGLQEIVWSEALHFFSADVLHPKDYRDLFFNDLAWSRIPQMGLWINDEREDSSFSAVYFPFSQVDKYPAKGSGFYLKDFSVESYGLPEAGEESLFDFKKPTIGLRVGKRFNDINLNLFGVFTKDPQRLFDSVHQAYRHSRIFVLGLTGSYSKDAWLFRWESMGIPLRTMNRLANGTQIQSFGVSELIENLGIEWTASENLQLSTQSFLDQRLGCQDGQFLACRIFQQSLKLIWSHFFWEIRATPQIWWEPEDRSTWVSLALERTFGDRTDVKITYENFEGSRTGVFSQLNSRDGLTARIDFRF